MRHGLKPRSFCLLGITVALAHVLLMTGWSPTPEPVSPKPLELVLAAAPSAPMPPAAPSSPGKSKPAQAPAPFARPAQPERPTSEIAPATAPAASEKGPENKSAQAVSTVYSDAKTASPAPIQAADFRAASLGNRPADYPRLARQRGWEGKVTLEVDVSAQGKPVAVRLVHSSGYPQLDEAALAAVTEWRFTPARRGNEALADTVRVPIEFRLQ